MIHIDHLSKVYPNKKGIFDVSFDVKKGEVFGFLGPNGAGKTTTIRQLVGFTNATSGIATINGLDCRTKAKEIHENLGYLPGEIAFFDQMTGNEFMDFISKMRGKNGSSRRNELIEFFELESDRKIRKMSKGMKQKVALITAFMHDPEILILDEPTSGLDPLMQRRFIELIQKEKARGKTILMSSHQFDEIERTCSRAAIIKEGRVVAVEDLTTLKNELRRSYFISLKNPSDLDILKPILEESVDLGNNRFEVFVGENLNEFLSLLSKCDVIGLESSAQTLEKIFIRYYGKEVR
ncbi:MAG: ABC transporter ATP-binding protein [Firmicutes bacterium GWF2_51_9]|nr:MAG: ABC transporter ATP-binding protein [Firmicutes bacterium GWF2_51_9]OGS57416.1 MAG: ABC transporter ATP-binding protein [Firmicutes bacterium GWE2_51_13]HAM63157.1 ABC transporter ATP-binding protein [Erysipelotrichaceae bacterium]HBZ41535.1 ABC transporter ATP-binding protein [Erysipelotrichaceae bacterium]